MSEWMDIARWAESAHLARPGIVFEVRNAEGQILVTPYVFPLPAMPFDWRSPPVRFRAIEEPSPDRSTPIPEPRR